MRNKHSVTAIFIVILLAVICYKGFSSKCYNFYNDTNKGSTFGAARTYYGDLVNLKAIYQEVGEMVSSITDISLVPSLRNCVNGIVYKKGKKTLVEPSLENFGSTFIY